MEEELSELSTNCRRFPNAEPFKLWFARLAEERIQEVINPELSIERTRQTYLQNWYSEEWTNARLNGIPVINKLTDEWKRSCHFKKLFRFYWKMSNRKQIKKRLVAEHEVKI